MKKCLITLLLSYPFFVMAQYSYFSSLYEPPDFENQNSCALFNLFVADTNLWCIGAAYVDSSYGHLMMNVDAISGEVIVEQFIPYDFSMLYSWGDTYEMTEDGNFIGTHFIAYLNPNYWPTYAFELDQNGDYLWQTQDINQANDSTVFRAFTIRQLSNGNLLSCGTVQHLTFDNAFQIGLLFTSYQSDGSDPVSVEIPFWNEEWQNLIPHEQIFPTDMIELDNGEILVSGIWADQIPEPFRRIPFILKLSPDLEVISNFEFGNSDVDNWYPWMHEMEDGKVMFAYAHGLEWDENIETYAIWDMRMGLFDPTIMDTLWILTYPHQGILQRLQDFEPTPDGGYIMMAQGTNIEEEILETYLLKVDSTFEEEWFKTYTAPVYSWDITMHDLEVTSDGGFALLGQLLDNENEYYKTWLLKLDACGDEQWSGCPFIGIEESPEQHFSVFPNPFGDQLRLKLAEQASKVEVYNTLGKLMNSFTAHREMTLDLSHLPAGAYIVCVRDESGVAMWSAPVVKE